MAQAVVTAAYYFGSWLFNSAAAGYAFAAVAAYGVSRQQTLSANRKARDSYNAGLKDRLISQATVDGPRSRLYGTVRTTDGIIFKATRGDKSQFYTLIIAVAGHEVDGIPTVYFNDEPVALDGNGYVLTAPWSGQKQSVSGLLRAPRLTGEATISVTAGNGSVTLPFTPVDGSVRVQIGAVVYTPAVSGATVTLTGAAGYTGAAKVVYEYRLGSASATKARVRKYLGGPGQDLSAELAADFPDLISSAHKFSGIALLRVDLEYDQDAYPMGVPNITALVRGAKVYDPRTGLTVWTNNPALCARDWALYAQGCAASVTDIDDASFIAAANACDVGHTFTILDQYGNAVPSAMTMYTCGLAARTDEDPLKTLDQLVAAMAGRRAFCGGVLRVRAGAYRAPVATITESWVSDKGDIDLVSSLPRTELFNVVKATIADAAQKYVPVPMNDVRATAYIEADGIELPTDLTLAAVTSATHAQHICGVLLRESRQAVTLRLPCNNRAFPLEVFDCALVTLPRFGFDAKLFEVLGWEFSVESGVTLTLRETDASVFDPDAEFTITDPAPNTALPSPFGVRELVLNEPASGTAQLLRQADGSIVSRLLVSWPEIQDESVRNGGAVEIKFGPLTAALSAWQTIAAPGADVQAYLTGVQDGAFYGIQARARNRLVAGDWSAMKVHRVLGKSEAPAAVVGLSAAVIPGALRITRTPSTELDYSHTLYRHGASWAAGTPITGQADRTGITWAFPPAGAYTIWAADVDTTGNVGAPVSYGPVTVTAADVTSAAAAAAAAAAAQNTANLAKGKNLFSGSLATASSTYLGGAVAATGLADPQGGANAVTISIPAVGSYVHYRAFTGLAVGYYTVKLRVFVGGGDQIVVSSTDASTWAGGNHTVATRAGTPGWVQVSLRQYTGTGNLDVTIGSFLGTPEVFSSPLPIAVNVSDLWVEREDAGATQAVQAAADAQGTATTAAGNATSALSTLATMRSNGYIDAAEKPALIKAWQAAYDEAGGIYTQGTAYGLTSLRDAYNSAFTALGAYLSSLSPGWADTTTDTPITPAVDQAAWAAYYSSRQALLNAVSDETAKRADWGQVGGSGKPLDNAGRTLDLGDGTHFGARNRNDFPSEYPYGRSQQFKQASSIGLTEGDGFYCTLETIIQYTDDSGGRNVQYAYQGDKTWRRTALRSASSWGSWTLDLDRNSYTGSLDATRNKLFKQDTDPASGGGDVQDGDRWQQTTSGVVTAVWDRIGGAWSNGPAGPAGTPGESVYIATVYLQAGSPPSAPTGGSFNFSAGVFIPPAGWSASQPATTTTPTYVAEYPFQTTTPSVTVTAGTWTTPVVDAVAGSAGTAGAAVFTVEIYLQTGGGAPAAPSGGSYTFTGDSLTPPSGWTRDKPASSTTPTYRCGYTFSTTTPGTPVAAGTWSVPVVVAQNGQDGNDGLSNALISIYQRSASGAPALPSATATYTFATAALTGLNNGWSVTPPGGTDPLYVSVATASSSGASDTIASGEWASVVLLAASGADGNNGLNAATVYLFQRTGSASAPALPSAPVTYTFSTGAASGVDNGWSQTLPTSGGAYRWATTASALSTGSTDTIANTEWAAAAVLAEDGANGDDAISSGLTLAAFALPADSTGLVSSYTGCTTTMTVIKGATDDTANWSFSKADSSGVTSALSGAGNNVLTVSAMDTGTDVGTVTITATRSGFPPQERVFALSKAKSATPASGPISAAGFWFSSHTTLAPDDCSAYVEFKRDGTVWTGHNPSTNINSGYWYYPSGSTVGDAYEIRFDQISTSGSASGLTGTLGTWQALSSARGLTLATTENGGATRIRSYSYAIRETASGAVVASGNLRIEAVVEI